MSMFQKKMKGKHLGGEEKSGNEANLPPGKKKKNNEKLHVARIDPNSGVFPSVDFLPPGGFTGRLEVLHLLNPGRSNF